MNPLEREIRNRIAVDGPLPIADYMVHCLTHPDHGYYTTRSPVGGQKGGDFITAPEVSQMFGEMIGVWAMEIWQTLGSPKTFNLVELGPGRGTLMKDLLRAANALPAFKSAAQVHLVEVSPTLSKQQNSTLSTETSLRWISSISDLPEGPNIIIANEFLDALPFRQWVKQGTTWHERSVGLIDDKLTFVMRPNCLPDSELPKDHENEPDGTIFETSPAREGTVTTIAHHLSSQSGAALLVDYGHLKSGFGDTFQAVRDHSFADPLNAPGGADLTSHVDFYPLVQSAIHAGCVSPSPVNQGEFLLNLGLLERAGALGSDQNQDVQANLRSEVERLAGGEQMGNLFKVMAFGAPASPDNHWPGF